MTWAELKNKVDNYLRENGIPQNVEIFVINTRSYPRKEQIAIHFENENNELSVYAEDDY